MIGNIRNDLGRSGEKLKFWGKDLSKFKYDKMHMYIYTYIIMYQKMPSHCSSLNNLQQWFLNALIKQIRNMDSAIYNSKQRL